MFSERIGTDNEPFDITERVLEQDLGHLEPRIALASIHRLFTASSRVSRSWPTSRSPVAMKLASSYHCSDAADRSLDTLLPGILIMPRPPSSSVSAAPARGL